MTVQLAIGILFLGAGIIYGIYMAASIAKDRAWLNGAPGKVGVLMGAEAVIYFLCTIGVSDFLLNTILCRRLHLSEPEAQPDNNIAASVVPSAQPLSCMTWAQQMRTSAALRAASAMPKREAVL